MAYISFQTTQYRPQLQQKPSLDDIKYYYNYLNANAIRLQQTV